ncbi:MAG: SpoIID/LytB domain-containing protein, partial [Deltaproteobacteria bacterium]|nr:SpoIID/LytB domain-containing protein [Deltaproteobacteria bacterium]
MSLIAKRTGISNLCTILLALFLVISNGHFAAVYAQIFTVLQRADNHLRSGEYLEAIGAYREIADQNIDRNVRARAYRRIGDIYGYFLNDNAAAFSWYRHTTTYFADSAESASAFFNAGMIKYEDGRYAEALQWFREYVRRFPRGDRRDTADFMIESCLKPPPVPPSRPAAPPPKINAVRVLVLEKVAKVPLSSSAGWTVLNRYDGKPLLAVPAGQTTVIEGNANRLSVNGKVLSTNGISAAPAHNHLLSVGGKPYRGSITVQADETGLSVINTVPLEQYLYGVVPKEMPSLWPLEALKCQAVAARTYALYQADKNRDRDYDLFSSTKSQVYAGAESEHPQAVRAVDETRGIVLLHERRLALAYFHANSGGTTENAERVWSAEIPYLKSVRDEFSLQGADSSWQYSINIEDLRERLRRNGQDFRNLTSVTAAAFSPSGRVERVKFLHIGGETTLSGNNFRIAVDAASLKSTLFRMEQRGSTFS